MFTKETSVKFVKLVETIQRLDQQDMQAEGKVFKHFIFTDIRDSLFGAKAVASFLMAAGFDLRMQLEKKQIKRHGQMVETRAGETIFVNKEEPNGFAILQSLPLWKNPLSTKTKKDILKTFNARPDNIHGERLRLIVLDSKFKEGIDLFDVKYVHLLEPPIANSDLKQAIGRATRFCGQRGLHFVPNKGWPLEVYMYSVLLPNTGVFQMSGHEADLIDSHELMMAKSGLDLALLNLTNELTVLAIRSSVDYDLNYKINNFASEEALQAALVAEVVQEGGYKTKTVRLMQIHDPKDITPDLLQRCLKRKTRLFPFTRARMERDARRMGMKIPRGVKRAWYCEQLQGVPGYLERLLKPEEQGAVPKDLTKAEEKAKENALQKVEEKAEEPKRNSPDANEALLRVRTLFPSPIEANHTVQIRNFFESKEAEAELYQRLQALKNKPIREFQQEIMALYGKFRWDAPIIKNGCEKPQTSLTFSKTQDFIRHYLVPDSPFKGLLAWHSVGTGKTCMAVAAATTQFEQKGYTILWVTRNSLVSDVYKNIFGTVCSIPMMERIQAGKPLPEDFAQQKRLLSKGWLPPISYKTFQNALEGKNELGRFLARKHADPLHKTFLVMDEVHKLQDGDLGAHEQADFKVIQKYIHASYESSKKDSVRPLLMTATPITDSPKELFDILNTLIDGKENRLIPFSEFRERFTDEHGTIAYEGQEYFLNKSKGLISYLNREYDPTTFAQPVFHTVKVKLEGDTIPTAEDIANICQSNNTRKEKRACYNETKKQSKTKSQVQSMEQCFGQSFPTFNEVMSKMESPISPEQGTQKI